MTTRKDFESAIKVRALQLKRRIETAVDDAVQELAGRIAVSGDYRESVWLDLCNNVGGVDLDLLEDTQLDKILDPYRAEGFTIKVKRFPEYHTCDLTISVDYDVREEE